MRGGKRSARQPVAKRPGRRGLGRKRPAAWFRELKVRTWALYYACRDPGTPWYAKAWAAAVVAYAFSPIDLIPDFIPVLGYLDDAILVPLGIALALRMIPRPVMDRSMKRARTRVAGQKPVNWIAGAVILLVWAVVLFFVARWILGLLRPKR